MDKPFVTITYKTANGNKICVEVSTPVKELLEQSDRQIRSQRRQDRRHLDFAVHTDEDLPSSLLPAFEDTADLLIRMERDARLLSNVALVMSTILLIVAMSMEDLQVAIGVCSS